MLRNSNQEDEKEDFQILWKPMLEKWYWKPLLVGFYLKFCEMWFTIDGKQDFVCCVTLVSKKDFCAWIFVSEEKQWDEREEERERRRERVIHDHTSCHGDTWRILSFRSSFLPFFPVHLPPHSLRPPLLLSRYSSFLPQLDSLPVTL